MASRREPDLGTSVIMENKKIFPLNSVPSLCKKKIKTSKKKKWGMQILNVEFLTPFILMVVSTIE